MFYLEFQADWFFNNQTMALNLPPQSVPIATIDELGESASSQALLLDNISKYEGKQFFQYVYLIVYIFSFFVALKDQKEKNGALFSSIISAAQRKVKRKTVKSGHTVVDGKEEVLTPNGMKEFTYQSFSTGSGLKEVKNQLKFKTMQFFVI